MTHTSEPWGRESDGHGTETIFAHSIAIAACVRGPDAARIVACVNACAGHRTEDLAMGVTLKLPRDEERSVNIVELRAQVAELAAALERTVAAVWDAHYGSGIATEYARAVDAEARAVLAKVRP